MSTAYTLVNTDITIGVQTFERYGEEKPRPVFHWAIEPIQFYITYFIAPRKQLYVAIEGGGTLTVFEFINYLLTVEVQIYDKRNIPA